MRLPFAGYALLFLLFSPKAGLGQLENDFEETSIAFMVSDTAQARSIMEEVSLLIEEQKYDSAMTQIHLSKEIFSQIIGENNVEIARLYFLLGHCHQQLGDFEASIQSFKTALAIKEKVLRKDDGTIAETCQRLGGACLFAGKYEEALVYLKKALEFKIAFFGKDHIEIASPLNNLGVYYYYLGQYDEAIEYYTSALNLRKGITDKDNMGVVETYENIGLCFQAKGDFKEAIRHYLTTLKLKLKLVDSYHTKLALTYNNLGLSFQEIGDYSKSIVYFNKALSIWTKSQNENFVAYVYNNLGIIYSHQGDIGKAIVFLQEATAIWKKHLGLNHPDVAISLLNLGILYSSKGAHQKGIRVMKESLNIFSNALGEKHQRVAMNVREIGVAYLKIKNYKEGEKYLKDALQIFSDLTETNHPDVAKVKLFLGEICVENKQYAQAKNYYLEAVATLKNSLGEKHPDVAFIYYSLGLMHKKQKEYAKSSYWLNKAIRAVGFQQNALDSVSSHNYLRDILSELGEVKFQEYLLDQDNPSRLIESKDFHEKVMSLRDKSMGRLNTRASKQFLSQNLLVAFERAIKTNKLLYSKNNDSQLLIRSFHLSEKSKSLLLIEALHETQAKQIAGIPDSLLQKEYDLRIDITYYDKKRQEKLNEGLLETDTSVLTISSQLFDLNQAYDSLKTKFEKTYPDYYKLKYDFSTISVSEIQDSLLRKDQALLEYFVGDSSIFIFVVTKDDYQVHQVKRDFPLQEWVEKLRDNIRHPHTYNLENYAEVAHYLYQKLLLPVADQLPSQLIIVPDGMLGYVPFEALLTEKPENVYAAENLPYLLRQKQISYSYSATLLREMQQKKHRQTPMREVLAMAPFATTDTVFTSHLIQDDWLAGLRSDTLAPLPYTQIELDSLAKRFEVDALYGNQATEQHFIKHAAQYRIVHLATHGKADARVGDYSYLAFAPQPDSLENEFLYVRDLYNLQLNADLVVLSACETGTGELQRGEGIISLARAFAYAGAKSIATTLWQVNDQSMQEIMVSFYRYLKAGMAKDEALRQAKLDYLDRHSGSAAYPSHWAAVIGVGDMRALK